MQARWLTGGIITDPDKHLVLQQYLCYTCNKECRLEIPVHTTAPKNCINLDKLRHYEEVRKAVEDIVRIT
ncbi:MAG: hypothetical protein WC456_04775 [Patescibacteria group bacterium]